MKRLLKWLYLRYCQEDCLPSNHRPECGEAGCTGVAALRCGNGLCGRHCSYYCACYKAPGFHVYINGQDYSDTAPPA